MRLATIRSGRRPLARRHGADEETLVRVRGGFSPNVVHARAGELIHIAFQREETASCSERVVFPAFGSSVMLPYGKRVVVELPQSTPGTYEFTCAMNVLRGTLVVE